MKVAYCTKYGPPEVVELREFDKPIPKDTEVLIKIHATSLHRGDSRMRGLDIPGPFFMSILARLFLGFRRVGNGVLGMELSGIIEAVGKDVRKFKVGDEVWASTVWEKFGAHAEYKTMKENGVITSKPANLSFKEAAVIPSGGITTLGIIKMANIKPGQKMLIYGASGSVGSSALLLAKTLGAEVTAVCSGANHDFVKSLGADVIVDYKTTDFVNLGEIYDIIFDAVDRYKGEYKKALKKNGIYLNVDKSSDKIKKDQVLGLLAELKELCEAGKFKAVIDRTYSLDEIVEAYRYVDSYRKRGNVVITVV
ncbi:MAG: NAD(P)-dependent alcohol dehydrogenase [Candidatus Heimdallarchaeota archaeon]|nr:NAD(P)-dependent alcohol dehydrogenase [Candidatus Heimdallarchaeota archaeon]